MIWSCSASAQSAPAIASTQPATVAAPGTIAAFYTADLYAKESGYITEVLADIGDHVKKGALLAVIDNPELQQQLVAAQATTAARLEMANAADASVRQSQAAIQVAKKQLAGIEADQKLAQVTLKRQEELFAGKAVTVQQLDEMRAKAQVASAAVGVGQAKIAGAEADMRAAEANRAVAAAQERMATAEVQRLQALLQYTKIVAPFDGVITRRWVNVGDLVQAATASRTTPLFNCQKIDVVRVYCDVPESIVAGIRPGVGAEVKLYGPAGQTIHGTVTRIAAALDPATRTMRAEIDLPNPNETLRPGMYAQVTLTPETVAQTTGKN
jgi:multidrug efflux pump subunit AcrA (membrane-fusion protein)